MTILVVVESPAKISKISSFLGPNYKVLASYGHFRDLNPKDMSIDFDKHFEPIYVVTKPDVVSKLKAAMKNADQLFIASDLDLEGEAIGQGLLETLKPKKYKRMIFNSITKTAILDAIKTAGKIDDAKIAAQKARRVIDRLFGYMISPLLTKKLGGKLSAGRVQSPTSRLVIDREVEIKKFMQENADASFFKVSGSFTDGTVTLKCNLCQTEKHTVPFKGKAAQIPLASGSKPNSIVIAFMKQCLRSDFVVHAVTETVSTRSPSAPFITSTLQQEANRKLGLSIDLTMKLAQSLYEAGHITYMRTDSVDISAEGHKKIKETILKLYGTEFYQQNIYKTKAKSAQEAHEAIRPTDPSFTTGIADPLQAKLYKLIWDRTIASQMKPAKINVTTVQISISKYAAADTIYYMQTQIERIVFPGFMKVYVESTDEPEADVHVRDFVGKIPKVGTKLTMLEITAKQEYARPPSRYTEASLVKKLEQLGIGRPSTYVNSIKTILNRGYIQIADIPGVKKPAFIFSIQSINDKPVMAVTEEETSITIGKESKKIIPTELGIAVNDFLLKYFAPMIDYQFTADMERDLDEIAAKEKVWYNVVQQFYDKLNDIISHLDLSKQASADGKLLGLDELGNEIFVVKTRYGPAIKKNVDNKDMYVKIKEPLTAENITLTDAIELFAIPKIYPKVLGKYQKKDVILQKGLYGFYLIYDKSKYTVPPEHAEADIDIEVAKQIIEAKKSNQLAEHNLTINGKKAKAIVLNGKFGPYVQLIVGTKKTNHKIPKDMTATDLTEADIIKIVSYKPKAQSKTANTRASKAGAKATNTRAPKAGTKAANTRAPKAGVKAVNK